MFIRRNLLRRFEGERSSPFSEISRSLSYEFPLQVGTRSTEWKADQRIEFSLTKVLLQSHFLLKCALLSSVLGHLLILMDHSTDRASYSRYLMQYMNSIPTSTHPPPGHLAMFLFSKIPRMSDAVYSSFACFQISCSSAILRNQLGIPSRYDS